MRTDGPDNAGHSGLRDRRKSKEGGSLMEGERMEKRRIKRGMLGWNAAVSRRFVRLQMRSHLPPLENSHRALTISSPLIFR